MGRILICALLLAAPAASAAETVRGPVEAVVIRVVDGDTLEVRAHIWLRLEVTTLVRIAGIDAPELHGECPAKAVTAREELSRLLSGGTVSLVDVRHDKYGRRVLAAGLAKPAKRGRVETCR